MGFGGGFKNLHVPLDSPNNNHFGGLSGGLCVFLCLGAPFWKL